MLPLILIDKYNIPIPRYTSYPTVPYWKNDLTDNTDWKDELELTPIMEKQLNGLQKDGLIEWEKTELLVTQLGWSFLRNICAVFDKKMNADKLVQLQDAPKFSHAV